MKSITVLKVLFIVAMATATVTTTATAQTHQEIFLFSQNNLTGNARFVAMGGAFGALGANFGVASTNPAGLGFYTRHEASISMAIGTWNSETQYKKEENKTNPAFDVSFQMPDIHYVYSTSNAKFQFGMGLNRLNDFNSHTRIEGDSKSSFTNEIANNVNVNKSFDGLVGFALDGWLLNYDTAKHTYFSALDGDLPVSQKQVTETKGNLTELALSFSGNAFENLYFGATIGIPMLDYNETSTLEEKCLNPAGDFYGLGFTNFKYNQNYRVDGTGINLKLGVVYKPINWLRIGLAFHTPTYYSIKYKFERELSVNMFEVKSTDYGWNGRGNFYESQNLNFKYKYFTPAKGILSLGFVIGTYGVIGIEGELLSYRSAKMLSNNDVAYQTNKDIKANYERVSGVVKFGTEWRVSAISLRAGYNYRSNPYTDKANNLWSSHLVTGGIGVRFNKSLSLDLGVMYAFNPETYHPYYLNDAKTSVIPYDVNTSKMLYSLTFNARF
jgi:hypothetical protein